MRQSGGVDGGGVGHVAHLIAACFEMTDTVSGAAAPVLTAQQPQTCDKRWLAKAGYDEYSNLSCASVRERFREEPCLYLCVFSDSNGPIKFVPPGAGGCVKANIRSMLLAVRPPLEDVQL